MATDYVLTASDYRWIEAFDDEDHARQVVAERGYTLTDIVVATDETRRAFSAWQAEEERRNEQGRQGGERQAERTDGNSREETVETRSEKLDGQSPATKRTAPNQQKDGAERQAEVAFATGREFRVGRVIGRGFAILFRNIVSFGLLTGSITLPMMLLQFAFSPFMPADVTTGAELESPTITVWVGIVAFAILYQLMSYLVTAALVYGTIQDLRGHRVSLVTCIRQGLRLVFPVIGVAFIAGLATFAGMVVFVVPGFIVMTMLWVVIPVAVVEKPGVFASLKRSAELTKGSRWRIFGVLIVGLLISMAANAIEQLITAGIDIFIFTVVVQFLSLVFFTALWAIFFAVCYHDLRVAKEGTDVEQIAAVFD